MRLWRPPFPEVTKCASFLAMDENKVDSSNTAYHCDHTHILYTGCSK